MLAAQIIAHAGTSGDEIICYVFCKYGEENKSDLEDIIRNLIHQIICADSPSKSLFNQMIRNARFAARTEYAQNMTHLRSLLQEMLRKETVCCIIDGLDECSNNREGQAIFINQLSAMFCAAKATSRLAVISRLDKAERENPSLWVNIQIHSADFHEDIVRFVSVKLDESPVLRRHKEKDRLKKRLVDSSDGMILWAELMIKELEAGHWNVDHALSHPPRGLEAMYAAIFQRLSSEAAAVDVRYILQLLLIAARPLRLDELAMGLALLKGLRSHEDYSLRGDPDREGREIIRRSTPLVNIMPDQTVQLAHTSLQEFLVETEEGNRNVFDFASESFRFNVSNLHYSIASCLITYLSFECFRNEFSKAASEKVEEMSEIVEEDADVAEKNARTGAEDAECEEQDSENVDEVSETENDSSQAISLHCYALLEYATRFLLFHVTQAPPSADLAPDLVGFFQLTQGWRWLHRLNFAHSTSLGHIQVMQSELRSWSRSSAIDNAYQDILGEF